MNFGTHRYAFLPRSGIVYVVYYICTIQYFQLYWILLNSLPKFYLSHIFARNRRSRCFLLYSGRHVVVFQCGFSFISLIINKIE